MEEVSKEEGLIMNKTIKGILIDSAINAKEMFMSTYAKKLFDFNAINEYKTKLKINDEYKHVINAENIIPNKYNDKLSFRNDGVVKSANSHPNEDGDVEIKNVKKGHETTSASNENLERKKQKTDQSTAVVSMELLEKEKKNSIIESIPEKYRIKGDEEKNQNLIVSLIKNQTHITFRKDKYVAPDWHAPWKLDKVLTGAHTGWVRCIDVDPTNNWFVTGSNDKVIKFWDLASGSLKVSLTGHINTVRGLQVSKRSPYLFSCGEDRMVKCWDLEQNKVVRHYHGHLSGVYCLALHPNLDIMITGGRDCVGRLWDIRTKHQIDNLEGHKDTMCAVVSQEHDPQIITGSHDSTIRQWDLRNTKTPVVLTHHKKSVRSLAIHHEEYTYVSGASDNLKVWKCPEGRFLRNFSGHNAIINSVAVNKDNVVVSGADDGTLYFWDYKSGYNFQKINSVPQPGSLSCEAGIFAVKFDESSTIMITAECDKTVKIWREDETATKENFPIEFN